MKVFKLETAKVRAEFLDYGATVHKFEVLEDGVFVNKVLSLPTPEDYIDHPLYCNAICGPTAGRIANGEYELNGKVKLSINNGDNHLHGGLDSYARKYFAAEVLDNSIEFKLSTQNKEYPGKQKIKITYEIIDTDLVIHFEADTDTDIPMNLTSHIYFNAFGSNNVLQNKLKLDSNKRIELVNEVPSFLVDDTRFAELSIITKLDDPFVIGSKKPQVIYKSEHSYMEVDTTYDSVVIFTQNFDTDFFVENKGICFETQKWPNGINLDYDAVLEAGKHYYHKTIYKFRK